MSVSHFQYFLDVYCGKTILFRVQLVGSPGAFTAGQLSLSAGLTGQCTKVGLWSGDSAEVFMSSTGGPYDLFFSSMSPIPTATPQSTLDWINRVFAPAQTPSQLQSALKGKGCACGAWLCGGIHSDYCIDALKGKPCLPYDGV